MRNVRPATHAGTWYTDDSKKLNHQLNQYFVDAKSTLKRLDNNGGNGIDHGIRGARILIGPHAGYTYSGARLAETFSAWDISHPIKTIFILGPSHNLAFKSAVMVSQYDAYATPLGELEVDKQVVRQLVKHDFVKYMSESVDGEEHSFEMHAPFIVHRLKSGGVGGAGGAGGAGGGAVDGAVGGANTTQLKIVPKIVPILISSMDDYLSDKLSSILLPYLQDDANHFIISSDFCHWGSRFSYTKYYLNNDKLINLSTSSYLKLKPGDLPVYKSVEKLDRTAMLIASKGDHQAWLDYISQTGNTICGQKPIAVILKMLEDYHQENNATTSNGTTTSTHDYIENPVFNWIGYSQSNQAKKIFDSSVSYASGYVKL